MKFHKQIHLFKGEDIYPPGSCWPTVYACLLDLELDEVLNFSLLFFGTKQEKDNLKHYAKSHFLKYKSKKNAEEYQINNYNDFLHDVATLWNNARELWLLSRGYREEWIADKEKWLKENSERCYIMEGISSRGVGHVVIGQNGKMIHDPHPSNEGLVKEEYWKYLRKIKGDYKYNRYYLKFKK